MASGAGFRFCLLCRQSVSPKCLLLTRAALWSPPPGILSLSLLRQLRSSSSSSASSSSSTSGKSLQPASQPKSRSLLDPLGPEDSSSSSGGSGSSVERRSADPNDELKQYIEYSKVNSWHAAVGRSKSPSGKPRWPYERLVVGVCCAIFLGYIYARPENSTDEQFRMDEFGKGLFRPNPAMEHHIAATIQTVEARGGDATLYRQQLKILLKEKELERQKQQQQQQQQSTGKVGKYDPNIHDVKY